MVGHKPHPSARRLSSARGLYQIVMDTIRMLDYPAEIEYPKTLDQVLSVDAENLSITVI